jgi:hypothetical protein
LNSPVVCDDQAAGLQIPTLVLSAAGFIATSTSGASPAVSMSVDPKLIWKAETPNSVPCGARISAGKSGKVAKSLPGKRRGQGELPAGQLHAVAGIAGKADDDGIGRQLDMPVISIDYRLAPEHRFPAAAVDCEAATRWIAGSPAELGLDVTGLVTSGDSAGGNLTIVTTMALRDNPAAVPVLVQHPIYPVVTDSNDWQSMRDFADGFLLTRDSMDYFHAAYAADANDYRGAPIKFPQEGMPPSLVTTASLDPLRDQGLAYVEALKAAGVPVQHRSADGNIHGHITLRKGIPSSKEDVAGNLAALKAMLAEVMADA